VTTHDVVLVILRDRKRGGESVVSSCRVWGGRAGGERALDTVARGRGGRLARRRERCLAAAKKLRRAARKPLAWRCPMRGTARGDARTPPSRRPGQSRAPRCIERPRGWDPGREMTGETLRRNLKCTEAPRVPLRGTRPGDRCASVDAIAANGDGSRRAMDVPCEEPYFLTLDTCVPARALVFAKWRPAARLYKSRVRKFPQIRVFIFCLPMLFPQTVCSYEPIAFPKIPGK